MYQLEFLPIARQDLIEIVQYITVKLKNPDVADRLAEQIIEAAEDLTDFPYRNPVFSPIRPLSHEYRTASVGNYLLFYRVVEEEQRILISRILYNRRNLESLL